MLKFVRTNEEMKSILDQYGSIVYHMALAYLKNPSDAQDIVQDVFLAFVEKAPPIENEDHLKGWLLRVAINKCKNKLRSFWFSKRETLDENYLPAEEMSKDHSEILKAVMSLSQDYRVVVHLYYYEDYSTKEIAQILNRKESTVRSQLKRSRDQLEIVLKEADYFE